MNRYAYLNDLVQLATLYAVLFLAIVLSYTWVLSERDPRKGLALEEPKPLISFCLFDACVTSPVLVVLRDANRLNEVR